MNKDTIIGFVLIAVVLIGFSWYNQPSAEEIEAARKQDSIETVMKEKAVKEQQVAAQAKQAAVDSMALNDTTALFHQAMSNDHIHVMHYF